MVELGWPYHCALIMKQYAWQWHLDWDGYDRQQKRLAAQDRESRREFVQRESHYFLGRRYLLNVIIHDGPARVVVNGKPAIDFYVPDGINRSRREEDIPRMVSERAEIAHPPARCKMGTNHRSTVSEWRVKKMKTKWGTCNSKANRIWINLELAKKPVECLEYIVVHEMVHLLERRHNERFISYMEKFLPQWHLRRDQLNKFPLRHEHWEY